MSISRRELLKLGTGTAAMLWPEPSPWRRWPTGRAPRSRSGCNCIPCGRTAKRICPAYCEAVAKMGYEGVEFAGYYDRTAAELQELLQKSGLKCCGTHISLDTLKGDRTQEDRRVQQDDWQPVPDRGLDARDVCRVAGRRSRRRPRSSTTLRPKLKEQDMRVGYHAHGGDFKKIDDEFAWDLLFANTERRRRRCRWTWGTAWKRVAIRSRRSNDSRVGRRRSISRNPAARHGRGRRGQGQLEGSVCDLRDDRRHEVVHRRARTTGRHGAGQREQLPAEPQENGQVGPDGLRY